MFFILVDDVATTDMTLPVMSNFTCNGNERSIQSCSHKTSNGTDCTDHNGIQQLGVLKCVGKLVHCHLSRMEIISSLLLRQFLN